MDDTKPLHEHLRALAGVGSMTKGNNCCLEKKVQLHRVRSANVKSCLLFRMKRHKRSHGRNAIPGQTLSLQRLELGAPIPSRLVFRSEIAGLARLHSAKGGLCPSNFSITRHAYIKQLAPSPDKALLAVASSDGHVEVHEPADTETLRLRIMPVQDATLSSVAWGSLRSSDCLLVGLKESAVALYDLNTCQADRPTRRFHHNGRSLSDVTVLDSNTFAVAIPNRMEVYDGRMKKSIAFVATGNRDAVLTGEDIFLYAADNGEVALWDRRKLTSQSSVGTMTKRNDAALSRLAFTTGRFNDICLIPRAASGSVFFYHSDGTVGHIDIVGKHVESAPEPESNDCIPRPSDAVLDAYGTAERSLEYPWYVDRRRIDVLCAPQGRGWRAIVPTVKSGGYRFVGFAPDMALHSFSSGGSLSGSRHYTCVHAVEGRLNRIIFGDAKNRVQVQEVDVNRGTSTQT